MKQNGIVYPVILAGGNGRRLWPISRAMFPKQLIALDGEESLLLKTVTGVSDPSRFAPPIVTCNVEHRFMIAEQFRAAQKRPGAIFLEPVPRGTAPAATIAALHLLENDPSTLMLLVPSDYLLTGGEGVLSAIDQAKSAAESGWLVAFGAESGPSDPDTSPERRAIGFEEPLAGFSGCFRVSRFDGSQDCESEARPNGSTRHSTNSGMFLLSAGRLIEEMQEHQPEVLAACRRALAAKSEDLDFFRLDELAFGSVPAISFDCAVMERSERRAVVPGSFGGSSASSWAALWEAAEKDHAGNGYMGDVLPIETKTSYLRSEGPLITTVGVEDMVVVATDDAVLVCPIARAEEIGKAVEQLSSNERSEHLHHPKVFRPWGSYESLELDDGFQVKHLIIKPGASLSLQRHKHRAEHWVVVRGTAEVTRDDDVFTLSRNQSTYIPLGAKHRLRNPGNELLHIVEVQSGDYLGEDDIERFEDSYGRASAPLAPVA